MAVRPRDITLGLRFAARLPGFLRTRVSHEQALDIVRARMRSRAEDLLFLARGAIYASPANPYRRLLALAGCEYGDLQRLVQADGVEAALATLYRHGVFLHADEFAGRSPIRRGSTTFTTSPRHCRNPWAAEHLPGASGGATPGEVILDLRGLRDLICDYRLGYDADGTADAVKACWTVPGSGGIAFGLVVATAFGTPPARWFSHVDVRALELRYRLSADVVRWVGRLHGLRFPPLQAVTLDDPLPIAQWLAGVLRGGQVPFLATYPAAAARLCQAALDAGIDLAGARFSLRGEPVTDGRVAPLRQAGVRYSSLYGATECGVIGQTCMAPATPDGVHHHADLHALIQVGETEASPALPRGALLLTSLRRTARYVLLNTSVGDSAVLEQRACGCPMERYGFGTHVHTIRSFAKLTGIGMTFADAEIVPILEHVLPHRYGGTATDYQLEEREGDDGRAQLLLVIHPRLGPLDDGEVAATFVDAVGRASPTRRVMSLAWKNAGVVRVVRRPPVATPSGKILHFRAARQHARSGGV